MKSRTLVRFCLLLGLFSSSARAAVLDCERVYGAIPFEGLFISNQFAGTFGMRFTDLDFTNQFPIIVQAGSPARCFGSGGGRDDALFSTNAHDHGSFFLTDSGVDVDGGPKGFIVRFDALVSTFSCYLLDLDADEKVTLTAYSSDADTSGLATNVFYSTNAPFGEGLSGLASISAPSKQIRRVEVRAQGRVGHPKVGFDDLSSDYVAPAQSAASLALKMYPGLMITGSVGTPYRIDYADVLDRTPTTTNWHALTTIFLPTSPHFYVDSSPTNVLSRFYRAVGTQ
ncbi:MAG TPA: hypothetical protein VNT99_19320 [Methylomirabilota bacterium]|nr:hypothetical protein [Methylomirabilota bacterium]